MEMKKVRKEAFDAGDSYYFTGVPCKYGHVSRRETVTGRCWECLLRSQKATRAKFNEIRRQARLEKATDKTHEGEIS